MGVVWMSASSIFAERHGLTCKTMSAADIGEVQDQVRWKVQSDDVELMHLIYGSRSTVSEG